MSAAAISAAVRLLAFPVITLVTILPSIEWIREWGLADMWSALIFAGCAVLYLFSARSAAPYDEADAMSRWMPSGTSMTICAVMLALVAAALLAGAI